ncbi:MAG: PDZ domain-containing protein [Planctomycetota bacterium]
MLRMKIQTIRSLLWIGNLLAISGIALLIGKLYVGNRPGSKMFEYIPPDRISKAMEVEATIKVADKGPNRDWGLLDNCWKLNVTGKEEAKKVEKAGGDEPKPKLKPIEEVLRVEMMIAAGTRSRASIHYLEDGDGDTPAGKSPPRPFSPEAGRHVPVPAPNLLQVGDALRSPYDGDPYLGKIQEITSEGVKFTWGGDDVVLQTSELDRALDKPRQLPGLHDGPVDEAQLAMDAEQAKLSRPLDDDGWFIGTTERDRIIAEQEDLAAEIGVGPAYSKREKRMYVKITKIPEGSLAEQRGFKVDDVLRRINGTDIVSKSDLIRYIQKHPDQPRYSIEIMRRGTRITKTFQIAR